MLTVPRLKAVGSGLEARLKEAHDAPKEMPFMALFLWLLWSGGGRTP
jgi:hypothetical protein